MKLEKDLCAKEQSRFEWWWDRTTTSPWRIEFTCRDCKRELSWRERMNSMGVCPHCGSDAGTTSIVASDRRPYRIVKCGWFGISARQYHDETIDQALGRAARRRTDHDR